MRNPWRKLHARTVIVNTHSDKAFHGAIIDSNTEFLTLGRVTMHDPNAPDPITLDGHVYVLLREIDFIQEG